MTVGCEFHSGVQAELVNINKAIEEAKKNDIEIFGRINHLEVAGGKREEQIQSLCSQLKSIADTLERWLDFGQNCLWKVTGVVGFLIVTLIGVVWYLLRILIHLPT